MPSSSRSRSASASPRSRPPSHPTPLLVNPRVHALLLVIVTLVAFAPLMTAEFTTWDDPETIAQNPRLLSPSLENLLWFWDPRHPYMDLYVPVTYTVWSALAMVAWSPSPAGDIELNPWIFHGANVLFHVVAALAAMAALRRLLEITHEHSRHVSQKEVPEGPRTSDAAIRASDDVGARRWAGAGGIFSQSTVGISALLGASLFALHPTQVESVGWASGTKDVLWGMFSLLALWQYLCYVKPDTTTDDAAPRPPSTRHYVWATVFFVLAMLSKPTAVVLPAIAAVIDVLLVGRPVRQVARTTALWFLLTVPIILEGRYAQPAEFADRYTPPLHARPLIAADALAWYAGKTALPIDLGLHYRRDPLTVVQHGWHLWTWIVPAAILAAALVLRRRAPWVLAGALVACLAVAPVSGIVPFDFQTYSTVSDHYMYLYMIGPALIVAFALRAVAERRPAVFRVVAGGAGVMLVVLGTLSFLQSRTWRDSGALFRQALRVNERSWLAHTMLGAIESSRGSPGWEEHFRRAMELGPNQDGIRYRYGIELGIHNRLPEAEQMQRQAMAIAGPRHRMYGLYVHSLAFVLASQGKWDDAEQVVREAAANPQVSDDVRRDAAAWLAELAEVRKIRAATQPASRSVTIPSGG